MPAAIETVDFVGETSKFLNLKNHQIARGMGISTWSRLRIAMLIRMDDSGANITSTPRLVVGVNSGTTNLFDDATTSHFVGFRSNYTTWTRTASPLLYTAGNYVSSYQAVKKVGTTVTANAGSGGDATYPRLHGNIRTLVFFEITKGSPNYTVRWTSTTSTLNNTTHTYSILVNSFEIDTLEEMSGFLGASYKSNLPTASVAVNEAVDGTLDSIFVSWNKTSPGFCIDAIGFGRKA